MNVPPTMPDRLDVRQQEILRVILEGYLEDGEPVGSETVAARLGSPLSPATVRAAMGSLASEGLLAKPHRSAGRVPTERAYRIYIDHWIDRPTLETSEKIQIESSLRGAPTLERTLADVGRLLSRRTNQVGLVLAPDLTRWEIRHVEFVRLSGRMVEAILLSAAGAVEHRRMSVGESWEQEDLDRCGRYLTERYQGMTLPSMRAALRRDLRDERAEKDRLFRRRLELGRQTLRETADEGSTAVIVEGASNLMDAPEFADPGELRDVLRSLEERQRLVDLLSQLMDEGGTAARIGGECGIAGLGRCSIVTSTYGAGDRVLGTVGIVGPMRMHYAHAFALVEHLGVTLSRWVEQGPEDAS